MAAGCSSSAPASTDADAPAAPVEASMPGSAPATAPALPTGFTLSVDGPDGEVRTEGVVDGEALLVRMGPDALEAATGLDGIGSLIGDEPFELLVVGDRLHLRGGPAVLLGAVPGGWLATDIGAVDGLTGDLFALSPGSLLGVAAAVGADGDLSTALVGDDEVEVRTGSVPSELVPSGALDALDDGSGVISISVGRDAEGVVRLVELTGGGSSVRLELVEPGVGPLTVPADVSELDPSILAAFAS